MSLKCRIEKLNYQGKLDDKDTKKLVDLIKKDNSKKIIEVENEDMLEFRCPTCHDIIDYYDHYCRNCGQKLEPDEDPIDKYITDEQLKEMMKGKIEQ